MTNRTISFAAAMGAMLLFPGTGATQSTGKSTRSLSVGGQQAAGSTTADSVPPEYASQGREELNPQGVPLREYPRQLSLAEADTAQKAAADVAQRRQHDTFLLTTYTQVRDIEQLRDERVALIDGQMDIARGSITSTEQRIAGLQDRMRNFQPYSASPNARRGAGPAGRRRSAGAQGAPRTAGSADPRASRKKANCGRSSMPTSRVIANSPPPGHALAHAVAAASKAGRHRAHIPVAPGAVVLIVDGS